MHFLKKRWVRIAAGAVIGAVMMVGLGQLMSHLGSGCSLLCRPGLAAIYGAVLGLVLAFPAGPRDPPPEDRPPE